MGLVDLVKSRVNGRPPIELDQLRSSKPLQNPTVTIQMCEDGSALIEAPLDVKNDRLSKAIKKWSKTDSTRKFELEPVGAFVFSLCDGQHTFEKISKKLRDKYKMNRLEADASLTAFLQTLSQRGLITLMVAKK